MKQHIEKLKAMNRGQLAVLESETEPDYGIFRQEREDLFSQITGSPQTLTASDIQDLKQLLKELDALKLTAQNRRNLLKAQITRLQKGKTTVKAYGSAGYKKVVNRVMNIRG